MPFLPEITFTRALYGGAIILALFGAWSLAEIALYAETPAERSEFGWRALIFFAGALAFAVTGKCNSRS